MNILNSDTTCPCGSNINLSDCCAPYLGQEKHPSTAEALMRSRYTAYTQGNVSYIKNTLAPESSSDFDINATKKWMASAKWKGLKILKTEMGQADDKKGVVEFIVTYSQNGETLDHHEVSQFRKNDKGHWMFVEGDAHTHREGESHEHHHHARPQTITREEPKIGRNDPCSCGSGKKYKKCCGSAA